MSKLCNKGMKLSNGRSILLIGSVIVLVIIVGIVGYIIGRSNVSQNSLVITQSSQYKDWSEFNDKNLPFSFEYPSSWKLDRHGLSQDSMLGLVFNDIDQGRLYPKFIVNDMWKDILMPVDNEKVEKGEIKCANITCYYLKTYSGTSLKYIRLTPKSHDTQETFKDIEMYMTQNSNEELTIYYKIISTMKFK